MKKQIGLTTLSLMLVTPALAGGAGAPVAKPSSSCKTIAQIVRADPNFSTLATAVDAAGLTANLSAPGSLTVFAPTNAAFAKVPSDQLANLLNDPEMLRSVVLYHVVAEKATAAQIRAVTGGTTVQGADLTISVGGNKVMVNNATVTKADIQACNGIIHVIDAVLMPPMPEAAAEPAPVEAAPAPAPAPAPVVSTPIVIPATPLSGTTVSSMTQVSTTVTAPATTEASTTETTTTEATTSTEVTTTTETTTEATTETTAEVAVSNTLYDVLSADERFTTFLELLSDAELTDVLTSDQYTILAPTNDAFAKFDEATLVAISSDKEALKKFLQYFIITKSVSTTDLSGGQVVTLQGSNFDLGSAQFDAQVTGDNGLIYPLDTVLISKDFVVPVVQEVAVDTSTLSPNITTYIISDPNLSTARALLTTAGMADLLTSGEYTVILPTNDAFAKLDAAKLDAIKKDSAQLAALLKSFIIKGKVAADALVAAPVTTEEGGALTITKDDKGLHLGQATVTLVPIETGNGYVYISDTIELPASLNK